MSKEGGGKKAIWRVTSAKKRQKEASFDGYHDPVLEIDAKCLEAEGKELLEVGEVQMLAGNEAVEADRQDVSLFREVLKEPDSVSVDASLNRMRLLDEVDCLEMATDAAETIDARNSLEKMLAHQMTACHVLSMQLTSKAKQFTQNIPQTYAHPDTDKAVKLVNAIARLMDTFQRGLTTLAKIRTGGQQKVTVEHVHVNKGGQAIVGAVNQGGGGSREGAKGEERK